MKNKYRFPVNLLTGEIELPAMITELKFPKRFEIEGLNPMELKVKIITLINNKLTQTVYENLGEAFSKGVNFNEYALMADKHEEEYCIRFESKEVNQKLSK